MSDLPATNAAHGVNPLTTASALEPFFFGAPNRRLYGCYHEPPGWPAREMGVVICYPQGQEYIRTHRACLYLADRMARAGFPVLRFDYYGTGDSAGDGDETDLAQWQADLKQAVEELRARSGVESVLLAGVRLGATLALQAAPRLADIAGLLLWEPVTNGRVYLDELITTHEETIWRFATPPKGYVMGKQPAELLGFPLSPAMCSAIEQIDLTQAFLPRNKQALVIESHAKPEMAALAATLQAQGAHVSHQNVPSFSIWTEDVDKGLVPQNIIDAIVAWMDTIFP